MLFTVNETTGNLESERIPKNLFGQLLHVLTFCSLTNCSQMDLVEIVWSRIKICLETHQRAISWTIWNPSQQFWYCISSCLIYIEHISAELREALQDIQEKIITGFELALQACHFFYLHTPLCSWCALQKSAFESDCLRLFLPTLKLVQIRGKFALQAEGMLHEQINTKNRSLQNQHYHPTKHDAFPLNWNLSCQMKATIRDAQTIV